VFRVVDGVQPIYWTLVTYAMRDELGIDQATLARPMQAAWISAASFASFALIPIAALLVAPPIFAR